ncbi:MAG: SIMPL domain-containing protein [Ruminiclostridium sp.]|nr:SIMPL domain-containing protein [Ruminiclostridium sp.]
MKEAKLTVKGIGKISLSPDQTVIDITIESRDMDYNKTVDMQHEKTQELKNALTELGVDISKLKTSNFNVNTNYENIQTDNGRWERKFAGYIGTHHLSLKFGFDTEKLKWIISAVTSCKKANPIFNISFDVKDKESVNDKLLELAVSDAMKKAAVLSSAANVDLGGILSIDYDNEDVNYASPTTMHSTLYRGMDCGKESAPDISFEPESIQSRAEVTVVWEIKG